MAATHLTAYEAQQVHLTELIRRAASGEKIVISSDRGAVQLSPANASELDPSISATKERLRLLREATGEPLRLGSDFADDLEEIIAMRRPGRGDPWA